MQNIFGSRDRCGGTTIYSHVERHVLAARIKIGGIGFRVMPRLTRIVALIHSYLATAAKVDVVGRPLQLLAIIIEDGTQLDPSKPVRGSHLKNLYSGICFISYK